jgi:hypothetical protein
MLATTGRSVHNQDRYVLLVSWLRGHKIRNRNRPIKPWILTMACNSARAGTISLNFMLNGLSITMAGETAIRTVFDGLLKQ